MDTTQLTDELIELGQRLLDECEREGLQPTIAYWVRRGEYGRWEMDIACRGSGAARIDDIERFDAVLDRSGVKRDRFTPISRVSESYGLAQDALRKSKKRRGKFQSYTWLSNVEEGWEGYVYPPHPPALEPPQPVRKARAAGRRSR